MRYLGKTLQPEYTDLAVVIGPNARWVENDYEDLQREAPEVLLGYRVRLLTAYDVMQGKLRGWRAMKVILLDVIERDKDWLRVTNEVGAYLDFYPWARVEYWHVHRVNGVYQIG